MAKHHMQEDERLHGTKASSQPRTQEHMHTGGKPVSGQSRLRRAQSKARSISQKTQLASKSFTQDACKIYGLAKIHSGGRCQTKRKDKRAERSLDRPWVLALELDGVLDVLGLQNGLSKGT